MTIQIVDTVLYNDETFYTYSDAFKKYNDGLNRRLRLKFYCLNPL